MYLCDCILFDSTKVWLFEIKACQLIIMQRRKTGSFSFIGFSLTSDIINVWMNPLKMVCAFYFSTIQNAILMGYIYSIEYTQLYHTMTRNLTKRQTNAWLLSLQTDHSCVHSWKMVRMPNPPAHSIFIYRGWCHPLTYGLCFCNMQPDWPKSRAPGYLYLQWEPAKQN